MTVRPSAASTTPASRRSAAARVRRDRQLARAQRGLEHAGDHRVLLVVGDLVVQARLLHVRDLGGHPRRHLAHHREDRALGGLAHRPVRAVGGTRHGGGHEHRVDQLARPGDQLLGGTAEELEGSRRVAARASSARGPRVDELVAPDSRCRLRRQAVELVKHARSVSAMFPRFGVGDREHVRSVTSRRRVSPRSAPLTTREAIRMDRHEVGKRIVSSVFGSAASRAGQAW